MTPKHPNLQDQIRASLDAGAYQEAYTALQSLWLAQPGSMTAAFALAQKKLLDGHIPLTPQRVAILRSFTVEPVIPILKAEALMTGVDLSVHVGEFNAYASEILGHKDSLNAFDPDVIILAVQTRDVAPELWQWEDEGRGRAAVDRVLSEYRTLLSTLREKHRATVIVHDFEQPPAPRLGLLDLQSSAGQSAAIQVLNDGLRKVASEVTGVFVLGFDALVANYGRIRWFDHRKWLTARLPFSGEALRVMAAEWNRFVSCLAGRISKVIVTDLDNTLWGGVVGEDGPHGIRLSQEYPGAAFRELQDALLACHERGILLAIASKNNAPDALEVIDNHPDMLLRSTHFAAMRINWNNKAQSIQQIAAELNVGVDSVAFLDDNPVERELVRRELPSVTVLDLPADPLAYAAVVRNHPGFQRLTLSREDRDRSRYYAAQVEHEKLAQASSNVEDFYRSLQQRLEIQPVSPSTVVRISQLTQKTNQFNLTTKRYTEQDILRLSNTNGWTVYGGTVIDRFGDNGLVTVAITHLQDNCLEIDTFLMSCRVISRTVETAVLSYLAEEAQMSGCTTVRGWFLPTKKNGPAADFFSRHGFVLSGDEDGQQEWSLDLGSTRVDCPEWIEITAKDRELRECARA